MENLKANEIRELFLQFFEEKNHKRLKSFSLVPNNDKSLLLINAGMAPMKNYFLAIEEPPSKRVTTAQKCIRTGDIENVGKTARHGTFFEMLGNFSFGDYFKEEIIPWTWEFVTEVLKLPLDKLYVTVYTTDDETYDIWHKKIGVPKNRISRLEEDNFWEIGVGPCGPCTELYYDMGEEYGCDSKTCGVGCDCDRYLEFWNLVFIQFDKDAEGKMTKLENPSVDTGMGLERISTILQRENNIFDIDISKKIIKKICEIGNYEYGSDKDKDVSVRIIADHVKASTFLVSDGVMPSNEGRGYVLRKLLRRAIAHGKKLNINKAFVQQIVEEIINIYKGAYEELEEKKQYINKIMTVEESKFYETIEQGMKVVNEICKKAKEENDNIISGVDVFKMYDTYGFPIEVMEELLEDRGIKIDLVGFKEEMEKQKQRGRDARKETSYTGKEKSGFDNAKNLISTKFDGYENNKCESKILAMTVNGEIVENACNGEEVAIILDGTTFYAESGGQCGDVGIICTNECTVKIKDCVKFAGDKFVHVGEVVKGTLNIKDKVEIEVDEDVRESVTRNHTATHILHKVLKEVLGDHVEQAGSNVTKDRLRFDFNHFEPMTSKEIKLVEQKVNEIILKSMSISIVEKNIEDAKKMGAMSLFGEKYSDVVRVVSVGDYSIELCGGTHLKNSSSIGTFKIISESGISSGIRRIEAVTGSKALQYVNNLEDELQLVREILKTDKSNLINKLKSVLENNNELEKEIKKMKSKNASGIVDELINKANEIDGVKIVSEVLENKTINELKELGDKIKDKIKSSVVLFVSEDKGKVNILCMVTEDLVKKGVHAGNVIKEASKVVDGRGGGRPNMAQGGGSLLNKKNEALEKGLEIIKDDLK